MIKICGLLALKIPSPHGGGLGWGLGKLEDFGVEEEE